MASSLNGIFICPGMSEAEVRAQLAQEEEEEVSDGKESLHEMSPVAFIAALLDFEEKQYVTYALQYLFDPTLIFL